MLRRLRPIEYVTHVNTWKALRKTSRRLARRAPSEGRARIQLYAKRVARVWCISRRSLVSNSGFRVGRFPIRPGASVGVPRWGTCRPRPGKPPPYRVSPRRVRRGEKIARVRAVPPLRIPSGFRSGLRPDRSLGGFVFRSAFLSVHFLLQYWHVKQRLRHCFSIPLFQLLSLLFFGSNARLSDFFTQQESERTDTPWHGTP